MAANRKILLRPSEAGHYEEKRAGAAGILPGMNVVLNAAGEAIPGLGTYAIVREDTLQGRTVDDAYEDDDVLFLYHPVPGDRCNLLLTDEQNITIDDKLAFAATGKLVLATTETDLWQAEEALDLTGADGDQLIACRKL